MNWTEEQRRVIDHADRHAIVTAVAGSGKTSTLVAHVLRQLERGQDPARMLVLMFNRSARIDFERKLARSSGPGLALPDIRTYHAMGLRLYGYFHKAGLLPSWQGDPLSGRRMDFECWKILQQVAPASLQDAIKSDKSTWVSALTGFIDLVKSTIRTPEQVFEQYGYEARKKVLLEAYHRFESWRLEQGLITYADMLYQPVMLMVREPDLVRRVTDRMDLILVDEYQDTNEVQHTLLKMIAGRRARVMVVGDPDQTIYEFRGARPEYILRTFAEDFPDPQHYDLSYTFRYGHRLALMADHLIAANKGRGDTLCISHSSTPDTLVERVESGDHARWLVQQLQSCNENGDSLSDIVVLVRLWSQAVVIELALLEAGIPFTSEAEKGALERQEIQCLLTLLELAAGRFAEKSVQQRYHCFWQLLRFPHIGIRDQWLQSFCQQLASREQGYGRWMMKQAEKALPGLSDFQKNKLLERGRQFLRLERGEGPAARLLAAYLSAVELRSWLRESALDRDRAEEQILAQESFNRYLGKTGLSAVDACEFFEELQRRRKATNHRGKRSAANSREDKQRLLLTSIHRAKGLEWPVVIIPGLIDKQLPCVMGNDPLEPADLESERRLLYVAMTRACRELYLLTTPAPSASNRVNSDRMPSRFIGELRYRLSCQLGERLGNSVQTDDSTPIELDYPVSDIASRYLDRVCPGLVAKASDKAAKQKEDSGIPWQRSRVVHTIFGAGEVLSETGTDFRVRFAEDGREYDFSKKSAHLYFS